MSNFGRTDLNQSIVYPTSVTFDGRPRYKPGGVTLDTSTLPAAPTTDTTLLDQSVIRAGQQYLRFGQVLCKINTPPIYSVVLDGTLTGGTFPLTVTTSGGGAQTTAAIPFDAEQDQVQTALAALSNVGAGNVEVSALYELGGPYTVTFGSGLGVTAFTGSATNLVGTGASVAVTAATGGVIGMYGPYDPNATDGRATLQRGECWVLDNTWLANDGVPGVIPTMEIIGGVIDGGHIWSARILNAGTGAPSLAAGPTWAAFLAAFPEFEFAEMQ